MISPRRLSSARSAWAILIVSMTMRALVPAGFMAGQDAGGSLTVQLCTATGLRAITLPPDEPGPPTPRVHGDGACLFSLASGAALPSAPSMQGATPTLLVSLVRVAAACVHVPAIVRAQSPRGPPAPLPA